MENQNINIVSLLSESSLSGKMKNNISKKLNKLVTILEKIHTGNVVEIDEAILLREIKLSANTLVKKSDKFQKEIIETTIKRKEESMEMLEISKLRLKTQIKDLEKNKTTLTVKSNNSFFYTLRNNLFNLLKINTRKKNSEKTLILEKQLEDYKLKLSNCDNEKDKLTKDLIEAGSTKLTLLRNQTYQVLTASSIPVTTESIQSIKTRIKNF